MTSSKGPRGRTDRREGDRDLDARLASYLADAPDRAPAYLLGATAVVVHATPQRRRGWRLGGTMTGWAVVAAVAAIAVIGSLRFGIEPDHGVPGSSSATPAIVRINPGRDPVVTQQIATPTIVRAVFVIDGNVWAVLVDGLVFELDLATGEVLTELDAQLDEPTGVAAGAGAIWIGSADGDLVKVDAESRTIETEVAVGIAHHTVAASDEAVWVAGTSGVRRIDAATLDVSVFDVPPGVVELAAVGDEVWATYGSGDILIVDAVTGATRTTLQTTNDAGQQPGGIIAVGIDDVWVTDARDGDVLRRIDPARPEIVDSIRFDPPGRPSALAPDEGGVWVLFGDDGNLVRIERDTLAVVDTINVGLGARGIGLVPNGLTLWGAGGVRVLGVEVGA